MDVYTKPVEFISWSDIETFCAQVPKEGAYLDFKREFPKDLGKTIAAMANTFGGIILIGVDENEDTTPKLPMAGIPFERGLEERVTAIILSNIAPVIFPEVTVCQEPGGERAIVLIRVHQSHVAPHAQKGSARVYVRTGNQSRPETEASLDQIFWLKKRRSESVELRQRLKTACEDRLDATLRGLDPNYKPAKSPSMDELLGNRQDHLPALLTLFISPTFPERRLVDPQDIRSLKVQIEVPDWFGSGDTFPLPGSSTGRLVDEGWLSQYWGLVGPGVTRLFHTQLTSFGQFFYSQDLLFVREANAYVRLTELIARIDQFTRASINLYKALNYFGSLTFEMNFCNLEGTAMNMRAEQPFELHHSLDRSIEINSELTVPVLTETRAQLVFDSIRQIGWAFDQDLPPQRIDGLMRGAFGQSISD